MKFFFISLNLLMLVSLAAQNRVNQASWQQRVDCEIDVQLHPETKTLSAFIQFHYYNHSPDTLNSIWMHVWPNAYKNNKTAFARQQLQNGKTDFHFSHENEKGDISGFSFMSQGEMMKWQSHPEHIDIIELKLNSPLLPGADLIINTPFLVKLPKIFSRSGYKDSFFSVTQWYPKPAVYDINGWNAMPYLDQGEFYSEFGDYRVNISVPKSYMLASTGHVIEEKDTLLYPAVSAVRYTYTENNIHDFAWFAAKDFTLKTRTINIGNNSVKIAVYSSGKIKNISKYEPIYYLEKGVREYSKRVGNYPYKTCTVVIGPLLAGGGMEYPTITICSSADSSTIVHEVGHNWFYGILATNERKFPWMDESINTFFEQLISGKFKPDPSFFKRIRNRQWLDEYIDHLLYLFSARQGKSQPLNLPSEEFTRLNYGSVVYAKGPLLFAYLKQQLGDSVFSACVKAYYKEWQFKHPLPKDMQYSFERSSSMNLDWFFTDLLKENNQVDIVKTRHGFKVKGSQKLDSFLRKRDFANANPYGFLPEKNYANNVRNKKLISIAFPFSLPKHNASVPVNLTPIIGFNYYDKFYVGALLFNRSVFRNKLEYTLMPAYSFTTKSMVGYGQLNGLFLSHGRHLYKVEGGLQGHSFGTMIGGQLNQYYRLNPYIKFHFKHKGRISETIDKQLLLNFYHTGLTRDYNVYRDTNNNIYNVKLPAPYFFNYYKLTYSIENKHPVNAYGVKLNGEYGYNYKFNPGANTYLKTWMNAFYKYTFAPKNKFFKTELFAGIFLQKKGYIGMQQFYLSGNTGKQDYLYNEAMFGRNEDIFNNNNLIGRQLINANGNMRNLLPVGGSDKWMLGLANEVSLPGIIPLRIYVDLGYFSSPTNVNNVTVYGPAELYTTAGILLSLFNNNLEIFVPFYKSKQFHQFNQVNTSFANSIGFKLHLNKLNPFKQIDDFKSF